MYRDGWIDLSGVPTHVLAWGKWIREPNNGSNNRRENVIGPGETAIVLFCGNPGIPEFYAEFLQILHEKLRIPVWAVGHAGHESENFSNGNDRLYDLKEQIEHKATFLRECVPQDCRIYVIGHSMGAKIIVDLLKMEEMKDKLAKCYLLFPTIERIGDTRNATFLKPLVKYFGSAIIFLSWIFSSLPYPLKYSLLKGTFALSHGGSTNCTVNAGVKLIQPSPLRNVFHLVMDEMEKIRELDKEVITEHKNKLRFYYGRTDNWSPLRFYDNLVHQVPGVDAVVCDKGMRHAFSMKNAKEMAEIIEGWIKNDAS